MKKQIKLFPKKTFIQQSYLILFIILFASIFTLYSCINSFLIDSNICNLWLKDFTLNMTAELLGILLVVFSVNKAVKFREQQENNKFKQIAFRQLKIVLNKQLFLFIEMFDYATLAPDKINSKTLPEFLQNDDYYIKLHRLNLLDLAPILTPKGGKMDWLDYIHSESVNLKSAINQVVDRYSFYLDSEVVDLMEKISDAGFIRFITSIWEAKKLEAYKNHGDLLSDCENLLREYIKGLLDLVYFYNDSVTEDRQINLDWETWNNSWQHHCWSKVAESWVETTSDQMSSPEKNC